MSSIHSILCPIDFSDQSQVALSHAEDLARRTRAELVVAHVVEPSYPAVYGALPLSSEDFEARARAAAERSLAAVVDELVERGVDARALVASGPAAARIVQLVSENGFDLVVLGTHGLTGISHALLGSTAERVVRLCPCPVLSVKAGSGID